MKTKPHIHLFGEEINSAHEYDENEVINLKKEKDDWNKYYTEEWKKHRHHGGGGVIWGLIIFLAGIMLLLNSLKIVPWDFWQYVWPFWPGLLIILGVHAILGRNIISRIITFLITLALLGLIITYGLVEIASPLVKYIPQNAIDFINTFNSIKK